MGALKSSDLKSDSGPGSLSTENSPGLLTDEVFSLFTDLIYEISGIRLGIQKKGLLISRLTKRLKALGIDGFSSYYQRAKADDCEQTEMINCISTNTTKFFRENHHFEYIKNIVIPELMETNASDKAIRIWSAGCSTGEEPYSLASAVHEAFTAKGIRPESWDIKILATDISTRVLEIASTGIYEHEQIPDTMPPEIVKRYFLKGGKDNEGKIKAKDFLKNMIRFDRLNLKGSTYPFKRKFDIIFCRNVMIYFDDGMKQHVLSKFHQHLSDSGHLFLGHSETMFKMEQFMPVYITVYRKK